MDGRTLTVDEQGKIERSALGERSASGYRITDAATANIS